MSRKTLNKRENINIKTDADGIETGTIDMVTKLKIKNWSKEDQPVYRLQGVGAENLSNTELLAILIGSGTPSATAMEIGNDILERCGYNVNNIGKMTVTDLMDVPGVGAVTASRIMAAMELGRRRATAKATLRQDLGSSMAIYNLMRPQMMDLDCEEAWVVLMNQAYKLIKAIRISHGGITETAVDVRIIMKEALLSNATVLALCHNHPSNNAQPSKEDDRITEKVKKACECMRIYFLDHIIVCDDNYYSYHERGRI